MYAELLYNVMQGPSGDQTESDRPPTYKSPEEILSPCRDSRYRGSTSDRGECSVKIQKENSPPAGAESLCDSVFDATFSIEQRDRHYDLSGVSSGICFGNLKRESDDTMFPAHLYTLRSFRTSRICFIRSVLSSWGIVRAL